MNNVTLVGRLTRDPEVRNNQDANSTTAARFTLAVQRNKEDTDFINCVCFGPTADVVAKYLRKGAKVATSGTIRTGSYTNKDGVKVYTTDIYVYQIDFMESKKDSGFTAPPTNEGLPFN